MIAVRDGLQDGEGQWALLNKTPLAAKRSMFGVFACGCPPKQPIQSFRSSIEINKMFGWTDSTDSGFATVSVCPCANETETGCPTNQPTNKQRQTELERIRRFITASNLRPRKTFRTNSTCALWTNQSDTPCRDVQPVLNSASVEPNPWARTAPNRLALSQFDRRPISLSSPLLP